MTQMYSSPDMKALLVSLGYRESMLQDILNELDSLFPEIGFDSLKHTAWSALENKDASGLINSLKDLMLELEKKGYYRPDFPTKLIRLLVNGLNLKSEDIFELIDRSGIPPEEKSKEKEFLASCAAITQLGYILLRCIMPQVKAASSGPHVFLIIDSFSPAIFVDFSIDSIREIGVFRYDLKGNFYTLINSEGTDTETYELLTGYYSSFHATSGIGLSHNIHNNIGIAYDRLGRYEEAIAELKEALKLDPDYIEVHNNLAVTYSRMGMEDEAFNELHLALRLKPDYAESHLNLGNLYAAQGRYGEAEAEFLEALRLNPGYAIARNNLGNIYALQKKNEEAIREFQEALKLNPAYSNARVSLGDIYAETGRREDAIKEFEEALQLDPGFAEAYLGIGLAYFNLGSFDRAAQALARAVYLDRGLLEDVPDKLMLKVRQIILRLR